jgi:hypothetical protein
MKYAVETVFLSWAECDTKYSYVLCCLVNIITIFHETS